MAATWIICPNLWGARLFRFSTTLDTVPGAKEGITFLREFPRPRVQTRLEDFHDDDDATEISEPVEDIDFERKVAEDFMTYVAQELEKAARAHEFSGVILCAEIHLLTILQKRLGDETRERVIGTVAQDLYEVNESDLITYVRDYVNSRRAA